MRKQEILKLAIEKAIDNGYQFPDVTLKTWDIGLPTPPHRLVIGVYGIIHKGSASNEQGHEDMQYQEIIFSHEFAKAFWGDKATASGHLMGWNPAWKVHLALMSWEEDPIRYLEKFI